MRLTCFVVIACAISQSAFAQVPIPGYPNNVEAYDPREVAGLPDYCKYTQSFRERVPGGNNQAAIDRYYAIMGPSFHNMHHYCWGLMKTRRGLLLAKGEQARMFYLRSAIDEYDYVLRGAPADFVMLPEIYVRKGQNLVALGQGPLAVIEFEQASTLKPDYWPAYAYQSDYYKSTGNFAAARESLEIGLLKAPGSKELEARLRDLSKKDSRNKSISP
jgi:tetratricopeptide (TPR) repeat protein